MNALGVKDEQTRKEEQIPVVVNTLPWPRSSVVPLPFDNQVSAQRSNGKKYAVVQADAFATESVVSADDQIKVLGNYRATSSST